ncbi:hypothetical protein LEP1GSC128_1651 [Leptospira borgpetersenii str. 200801926]|uniref:Uncharacterized protein n=1 Tax=Leptospira borgpetersenii str. 200801926 TaxID=1193009 RepID=A0ABP2S5R6_LEPBO|nr:hypothetical protein LEP1GSC128_1651 [Leptospira borgpetersenii str. 200801926]
MEPAAFSSKSKTNPYEPPFRFYKARRSSTSLPQNFVIFLNQSVDFQEQKTPSIEKRESTPESVGEI